MIHIPNPYPAYSDQQAEPSRSLHANVPGSVKNYLLEVFPGHGNLQAVVNTLILRLVVNLRNYGIERHSLENEELILTILYGRPPNSAAESATLSSDVAGGEAGVCRGAPTSEEPNAGGDPEFESYLPPTE
jgi:hypothetical protein